VIKAKFCRRYKQCAPLLVYIELSLVTWRWSTWKCRSLWSKTLFACKTLWNAYNSHVQKADFTDFDEIVAVHYYPSPLLE